MPEFHETACEWGLNPHGAVLMACDRGDWNVPDAARLSRGRLVLSSGGRDAAAFRLPPGFEEALAQCATVLVVACGENGMIEEWDLPLAGEEPEGGAR